MKILGAMGHFIIDHLFAGLCCIELLEVLFRKSSCIRFLELAHLPTKRPALIFLFKGINLLSVLNM